MIMQQKDNADIVAREGDNVTLACDARGHPRPQVVWRREDKEDILVNGRKGIIKNTLIILCIVLYSLIMVIKYRYLSSLTKNHSINSFCS